jgi:ATP-dependent protease ClpP protease subunit
MDECVRRNQDKDNPRAWCADVMRKTEEHCKGNHMRSGLRSARPVAKLRQGRTDWFRITNKKGNTAEIYIYDEIGWFGTTAQGFVDQLRDITAPRIDLHLNSPGGDVFDGFAIYQALLDHHATIHVLVDGLAASAASFIAQAGDRVTMGKAAMMMIHDAFGLAIGNAKDMRELADRLDTISNTIAGVYSERAGGPVDFWREAMQAESWYSAEEAVTAGLADEVRERQSKDDPETDVEDTWDLSVFTYAGRSHAPAPELPAAGRYPSGSRSAAPPQAAPRPDTEPRRAGRPEQGDNSGAVPPSSGLPEITWDAEMVERFRVTMAGHVEQAPAIPDPPPPEPEPPASDPLFDPLDFISAIREATHAR